MIGRIAIYGLFSPRGICLYVGATKDPKRRIYNHRWAKTCKRFKVKLVVFNWVRKAEAPQAEVDKTIEFKRLGQARFNKQGAFGRMNKN